MKLYIADEDTYDWDRDFIGELNSWYNHYNISIYTRKYDWDGANEYLVLEIPDDLVTIFLLAFPIVVAKIT